MLVKGCRGSIIRLKSTGNRLFDEAFFVLRELAVDDAVKRIDVSAERGRIFGERLRRKRRNIASRTASGNDEGERSNNDNDRNQKCKNEGVNFGAFHKIFGAIVSSPQAFAKPIFSEKTVSA